MKEVKGKAGSDRTISQCVTSMKDLEEGRAYKFEHLTRTAEFYLIFGRKLF